MVLQGHGIVGLFLLFLLIVSSGWCRGVPENKDEKDNVGARRAIAEQMKKLRDSLQMGDEKEYHRYWQELMESSPAIAKRFAKFRPEDLAKKMGNRVARNTEDIRSQLEEMQRLNNEELRDLNRLRMTHKLSGGPMADKEHWPEQHDVLGNKLPVDIKENELKDRLKTHQKLQQELDHQRREEFKHYEMKLEHLRRKKLKAMDETQRLKEEERRRKKTEELKKHDPLLHPGSRKQLEHVWNEQDGLSDEAFDPRVFFFMHDTNGDKNLDSREIEAFLLKEANKAHGENPNSVEAREEVAEMREHVMSETDQDRDGVVSLEEWMRYTKRDLFNADEEWKPIMERPQEEIFSEKEMDKFEEDYKYEDYEYDYDENGNLIERHKEGKENQHQDQGQQHDQQQQQQQQQQQHEQQDQQHLQQQQDHHEQQQQQQQQQQHQQQQQQRQDHHEQQQQRQDHHEQQQQRQDHLEQQQRQDHLEQQQRQDHHEQQQQQQRQDHHEQQQQQQHGEQLPHDVQQQQHGEQQQHGGQHQQQHEGQQQQQHEGQQQQQQQHQQEQHDQQQGAARGGVVPQENVHKAADSVGADKGFSQHQANLAGEHKL